MQNKCHGLPESTHNDDPAVVRPKSNGLNDVGSEKATKMDSHGDCWRELRVVVVARVTGAVGTFPFPCLVGRATVQLVAASCSTEHGLESPVVAGVENAANPASVVRIVNDQESSTRGRARRRHGQQSD